jgi:hypothetical protein
VGHALDRSDVIDLLEEATVARRAVAVELKSNERFVDHVRDVVTDGGEEWAVFVAHEAVPVRHIHRCGRAEPWEPTYAGK